MCRNIFETSLFSAIYVISIIAHQYFKKKNYKSYITFSAFFFTMEFFQLCQWLFAGVIHTVIQSATCSTNNKFSTYVAFILIWTQPLLFAFIGYQAEKTNGNDGSIFKRLCVVYFGVALLAIGGLVYSTEFIKSSFPFGDSNYSNVTCTFIGKNNHLVWNFAGIHVDYQANHLLYAVLCIIAFVFYQSDLLVVPFSWGFTLFAACFIFRVTLSELPAYWCVLSVLSNIFIWIYELLVAQNENISV